MFYCKCIFWIRASFLRHNKLHTAIQTPILDCSMELAMTIIKNPPLIEVLPLYDLSMHYQAYGTNALYRLATPVGALNDPLKINLPLQL